MEINHETRASVQVASGNIAPLVPRGWMRAGFWVCVVIAVAAVVRRLIALAYPAQSGAAQMVDLDRVFASRAVLTLAHIVPAMAFVLLAPFIVLRRGNAVFAERLLLPLGVSDALGCFHDSFRRCFRLRRCLRFRHAAWPGRRDAGSAAGAAPPGGAGA